MYGSSKLCTFVIFPKQCVKNMVEKCVSDPGDQKLRCCSQGYFSPSCLSPNRDKVPHWTWERVSTQDYWDEGEEQGCPGSCVGFGYIYGVQFPLFMWHGHTCGALPRVNLAKYCNISVTSLMICLALSCTMRVLQPRSQNLPLKTKGASRNSSRNKEQTNLGSLL